MEGILTSTYALIVSVNAHLRILAGLLAFLVMLAGPSVAQDLEKGKAEIHRLRQMDGQVDRVVNDINISNFGPFHLQGKCGYDNHWYCFGDCQEFGWGWDVSDFIWIKNELQHDYLDIAGNARQFDHFFAPVKNWLLDDLPRFNELYRQQITQINTLQQDYQKHSGDEARQAEDRKKILVELRVIDRALQDARSAITAGMSNLSDFDRRMSQRFDHVKELRSRMETSINGNRDHVWKATENWPCGKDDIRQHVTNIHNWVRTQYNHITTTAEMFGVNVQQTDAASSVIIADLIVIQNKYNGTIEALQKASTSPNNVMQQLHLEVTYSFYKDLAAFAREEFTE